VTWIIVGGESGGPHDRRLVNAFSEVGTRTRYTPKVEALTWMRDLRDQCVTAGVPWFFKQWGGPKSKSGGRELDGRTWEEFPPERE
jgi:protein gp37